MRLIVLTGASGSGKTAIAKAIESRCRDTEVLFFDSIGVPSLDRMTAECGSPEEWQRAKTMEWMARIAGLLAQRNVLFEGQTRISFLLEALSAAGIRDYRIILVDCDDAIRRRLLKEDKGQPELANPKMMIWARFLRDEAKRSGCEILDTSLDPIETCAARVCEYLE
jgi:ATP-dependent 26S proteasome regulatory subunit